MKTKPFLLATAGSTVDGRTIDDKMLQEMASSYNPKTYGARLNIEHIRGISGDKPFRAYGDVLELSTGEVDVDFNGKTEKRLGLFGVFDVTEDAKALNDANQKVFPSIEIEPNFAGKGYAYMMGCALTDSPAAVGTDRLEFNRSLPNVIHLTADKGGIASAALEIAEDEAEADAATGIIASFFAKLGDKLGLNAQPAPDPTPPVVPSSASSFDVAQFTRDLGETLDQAFAKHANSTKAMVAGVRNDLNAFKKTIETTADPRHHSRPPANGGADRQTYTAADVF